MRRIVVSQFVSVDGVIEDPVGIEDLGRGPWTSVASSGPEWSNTAAISGDVPAAIARLKAQPGGDILVHGSARLTHTLIEHELVDEWRLFEPASKRERR